MKTRIALAALVAAASFAACGQSPAGDAARGKVVFLNEGCFTCHGTVGHGEPYGPKLAPHALPWEAFAHQVRHPRSSMPRYMPQYLSDKDLADIYAYVASIPEGPKASQIELLR